MRTIKLYHGTNQSVKHILNYGKMGNAANGLGFYLTNEYNIAKSYGMNVICFEVFAEDFDKLNLTIRKRCCDADDNEYVITTLRDLNNLLLEEYSDNFGA